MPLKYLQSIFYYDIHPQPFITHKAMANRSPPTNSLVFFFTKMVNENYINWDEQLHTVLYVYHTTFKVTIGHIPFQLVDGF
jgi:hypothetical protein